MATRQLFDANARGPSSQAPDLADATDAVLAQALIRGEPYASRVAWNRFSPLVRRILRRSLGPERDVEDTVQDVFLSVFDKVPTLRDPAALRAFIVSVAVRTLRYEIRRRRVRRWVRLSDDAEIPDLRVVHPDTDSREALIRFYRIMDRINTRDRTAFVLHFVEGMGVPEVAAALGVSVPTTRRCMSRARDRLTFFATRDPVLIEYVTRLERSQQ